MFSESWHRVADSCARLRPGVEVHRQVFRGQVWYMLRDPASNQFFRLRPEAYNFVARLRTDKTLEQVWRECLDLDPDSAPGQEEVIRLLAQLTQGNLIASNLAANSTQLFRRYKETRQREFRGKALNFLFLQIPLFDPDPFLRGMLAVFRPFLGIFGFLIWLAVIIWGLKGAADNWDALFREGEGVLSPDNWLLLYGTGFVVKLWHEIGHGLLCRRFGGEVRSAGVMLLVLTPMPYVDVTSSWAFRSHAQRMLVAAGGMLFELFLAAIAMQVWNVTGEGAIHSVAFNVMVLASTTTLLFNMNPLLRFDGYYIFCDLLQLPNLAQRSQARLRYILERYIFGNRHATAAEVTTAEAWWLFIYGLVSATYRVFLLGVIVLMVAEHFLGLGLALAAFSFTVWVITPVLKFIRYVLTDPNLERVRERARRITFATLGAVLLFAALVPLPRHFRAPGVVDAEREHDVKGDVSGYVAEVLTPSGTMVKKGDPLVRLADPENQPRIEAARLQLRQIEARRQFAAVQAIATLRAIEADSQATRQLISTLEKQRGDMVVAAPGDGLWMCPLADELPGIWATRGTTFGKIIDTQSFRFNAIVSQDESSNLFGGQIKKAEVRINGEDGKMLPIGNLQIIPSKQEYLPAAALGWKGGGPIRVMEDKEGLHAADPFFQVYGTFPDSHGVRLMQHRTGEMRITLQPEPLLIQGTRQLRQLLQQRLQL